MTKVWLVGVQGASRFMRSLSWRRICLVGEVHKLSDGGVMIRVSAFRRTDTSMVLNDSVCAAFSSIMQFRDERTQRSQVLGPGYWMCVLVGEGLGHRGG